jgi:hypothetical protein
MDIAEVYVKNDININSIGPLKKEVDRFGKASDGLAQEFYAYQVAALKADSMIAENVEALEQSVSGVKVELADAKVTSKQVSFTDKSLWKEYEKQRANSSRIYVLVNNVEDQTKAITREFSAVSNVVDSFSGEKTLGKENTIIKSDSGKASNGKKLKKKGLGLKWPKLGGGSPGRIPTP